MPRGIPNHRGVGPSENTQRLLESMRELEQRLAVERAKDRARGLLLAFAQKHGLSAIDLRNAARLLADRKIGDTPVVSKHSSLGAKLRAAREAKGLSQPDVNKKLGVASGAMSHWENNRGPKLPRYRSGLIKLLDLPKNFFDEAKPNGHAPP